MGNLTRVRITLALALPLFVAGALQAEEVVLERRASESPAARKERLRAHRVTAPFEALQSPTVSGRTAPREVTPPLAYALSLDGDLELSGFVFQGGSSLLHTDGGSTAANTALGLGALVSSTIGVPYSFSGSYNTAVGWSALAANTSGFGNTAVGRTALGATTLGTFNSAVGFDVMRSNTTGSGNTALGWKALALGETADRNTAVGFLALYRTTGDRNTGVGAYALYYNETGISNTAVGNRALLANVGGGQNAALGEYALFANSSGSFNTAVGAWALSSNNVGIGNTAIGSYAFFSGGGSANTALGASVMYNLSSGDRNVGVGIGAGYLVTAGSDNIWIASQGDLNDDNTLRIGESTGNGVSELNRAFVQGVRGITTGSMDAVSVLIDSKGQLGTVSSSRRFKQDIRPVGAFSERLLELEPVAFRYRQPSSSGRKPIRFGLIAEDVAQVMPELVAFDEVGRPETVMYHQLSSLLLSELQQQHRLIEAQKHELLAQREALDQLRTRIVTLEAR